ncbi:DUF3130 family protein [Listeria sp. FSL L7-0229]|uniref:DUF3130 family protein n=1 Tax=Listeria cossartiae TaxID=2838249 RepID=UPI0016270AEE|nr:DUF3130 family protein [Listeria cossartiae]MBC2191121.1 DUF3130 family protein [Listeria cossartiae subsp. cossartiae]
MTTVKMSEKTLTNHAEKIEKNITDMTYFPMKSGNMAYTQSNSINHYRQALLNLLQAVESFEGIVQTDSKRIGKIGKSMAEVDKKAAKEMGMK